jgi:hypothetical protein
LFRAAFFLWAFEFRERRVEINRALRGFLLVSIALLLLEKE